MVRKERDERPDALHFRVCHPPHQCESMFLDEFRAIKIWDFDSCRTWRGRGLSRGFPFLRIRHSSLHCGRQKKLKISSEGSRYTVLLDGNKRG